MIAKQNSSLVIKEEQLRLLEGVAVYKDYVAKNCAKMLADAQKKRQELLEAAKLERQQLKNEQIAQLQEQSKAVSLQMQQENLALLEQFIAGLEQDFFSICYKIVNKLHLQTSTAAIAAIINEEIIQYITNQRLTITTNGANLATLKDKLTAPNHNISFIEKADMALGKCIVSDSVSTVYIDLEQCTYDLIENFAKIAGSIKSDN